MGAADVVPGVSGGTIAFITGIYEELINTLKGLNLGALKTLKNEGIVSFWNQINGNFLVALFAGVFISLLSLAKLITYQLETFPIRTWGFFFGLIVASVIYIGRKIERWRIQEIASLVIGIAVAYGITIAPAVQGPEQLWFIFLSGCIAICAMILPGISGSFILLLLGSYKTIMGSLSGLTDDFKANFLPLAVFGTGCIIGLLSFSRLVSLAFEKARSVTMAVLTGFMIGSLNKVWPWKIVTQWRDSVDSHGEIKPLLHKSVLPETFSKETSLSPEVNSAIIFAIVGFALVLVLGMFDKKKDTLEH